MNKPKVKFIGQDGNVFNLIAIAEKVLTRNNMRADLMQAGFEYRERLRIMNRVSNGYVFYKIDPDTGDEIGLIERQALHELSDLW